LLLEYEKAGIQTDRQTDKLIDASDHPTYALATTSISNYFEHLFTLLDAYQKCKGSEVNRINESLL